MNPILVIALLTVGSTASPSSFSMTGLTSMEACEYARAAIARQHEPFKKKIVLWSVCVPNGPPTDDHKH